MENSESFHEDVLQTYQAYEQNIDGHSKDRFGSEEQKVTQKIYSDADYRKKLLLRVLPDFQKLDQFDQLHNDFISSTEEENKDTGLTGVKQADS